MSERTERFEIGGTPRLLLRLPAGEVRIVAGEPGAVTVRCRSEMRDLQRITIEAHGDTVTVEPERGGWGRWASIDLQVAVGSPPEVRARLASASLAAEVAAVTVDVSTASGNVVVGEVSGSMTARLASGDVRATTVGGRLEVVTASGDVRAERVGGSAELKAASGDVVLGTVVGDLTVRTASGDLTVDRFEGSRADVHSISGDVRLGVPPGRRYAVSLQSMSGDVRTDFPVSGEGEAVPGRLAVASISGDIHISGAH